MNDQFNIKHFLDLTNYATDSRVARRKGKGGSQEFFTPYSIIKRMCDKIPDEGYAVVFYFYIYSRL